jgi:hypothetical protein
MTGHRLEIRPLCRQHWVVRYAGDVALRVYARLDDLVGEEARKTKTPRLAGLLRSRGDRI